MAKTKKIEGVLIDPESCCRDHALNDTLDEYYAALHCTCIDIVTRKIGHRKYAIVCDDEGLLKDNPFITAVSKENMVMLVGALFICADDKEHPGELRSLTTQEKQEIHDHISYAMTEAHPHPYPILRGVEYC